MNALKDFVTPKKTVDSTPTVKEREATTSVVTAATFTAEPIHDSLAFWLTELGFRANIEFAPYNQVVQQLLDPSSEFGRNSQGFNLIFVRLEDYSRQSQGGWDEMLIRNGVSDLLSALASFLERSTATVIVTVTPPSPQVSLDPSRAAILAELETEIRNAVGAFGRVQVLGNAELRKYPVALSYQESTDRIGHMPYTPEATAAMAMAVARRVHAIRFPPHKVIVLDCDNTLWRGVLGEDGPNGIILGPGMRALQEFVVEQQSAGMLICLLSKNRESDVLEAFDLRTDFPLRRQHLVSWRIGWDPKPQGMAELARELNLGLDSFIFIDDNPVECAEMRSALPEVLTLQLPSDEAAIEPFFLNVWAFDRLKVTEEDRRRTEHYQKNSERSRVQRQSKDIGSFIASLELKIRIAPPREDEIERVAQLTQRTNQFNLTTIRRTAADIRVLTTAGMECLRVEVSDRFGDYGLVGVMIVGAKADALEIDTMLLSCRVLGRGVEHAMLAHVGKLAVDRSLSFVRIRFAPTAKNEPALKFVRAISIGHSSSEEAGSITTYGIPSSVAAATTYNPGSGSVEEIEADADGDKKAPRSLAPEAANKSDRYARIANELQAPSDVVRAVEKHLQGRRELEVPVVAANTAIQRELVAIWQRILHLDIVGIRDDFASLGGTSLKAAELFAAIEEQFGIRLPMTTILDCPTIEELAERLSAVGRGSVRQSLRKLKEGTSGGPSLFLVHDGDGETLLYINLSRRLPDDVTVYGIEPHGDDRFPILHTSITAMAEFYVKRILEVCPEGPYLLGGLCAGGTIAFEMALQLEAVGRTVGFVALLDAADSQARMRRFLTLKRRLASFTKGVNSPAPMRESEGEISHQPATLSRFVDKVAQAVRKIRGLVAYELKSWRMRRQNALNVWIVQHYASGGKVLEGLVGPSVRAVYEHIEKAHKPIRKLAAKTILFRAGKDGDRYPDDEPLNRRLRDPLFGWGERVVGGASALAVVDVAGGHGGILQEPNVLDVARELSLAIASLQLSGESR